jgi:hypothetical protein
MQRHLLQQKVTHRIDIMLPVVPVRLSEPLIMVTSKRNEKSSYEWSKIPLYFCVFLRNILYNFKYTAFLLSFPRTRQVCRTESLHPPAYPITAAVFRAKVKETRYTSSFLLSAKRPSCCQLHAFTIPRVTICVAPIGPSVTMLNLVPNKSTVIRSTYS